MVSIRVALFKSSIQVKITKCKRRIFYSNTVYQLLPFTFRMVLYWTSEGSSIINYGLSKYLFLEI